MSEQVNAMKVMERLMRICPGVRITAIPEKDSWEVVLPDTVYLFGVQPFIPAKFSAANIEVAIQRAWQTVTDSRAAVFVKGSMPWPSILLVEWDASNDDWVDSQRLQLPLEKREHYRPKK